ncbi:NAD-dependent epimerase/dehydratase family protein [Texcoconibacillus texcoconensis]|uniref:Nucleoside-diphosphate-sugar epimerase n=1 Tax=Texcoconibacillus texcoconensis TaxID=1095777 RepID=A0A840QPJ3_9BACI|nr:nucleoside-diphosphate-sugar epimerase [Texcoconibacillus texcoconensis]
MSKVLIFGGTRFFGKRLVEKCLANGDEVTIATRGKQRDDFGNRIERITVDRANQLSMETVFAKSLTKWDVIYDQVCFSPYEAQIACDLFAGQVGKYVFTSSLSVYDIDDQPLKCEKDFDPFSYPIRSGGQEAFSYSEGKRQAEAFFAQKASFPVTMVRPPIVLGEDDYTERLHFHVRKILKGEPIGIDYLNTKLSFVGSDDLAQFLCWIGTNDLTGPVNSSAPDQITLNHLLAIIEGGSEHQAAVVDSKETEAESPFNFPKSIYQDVSVAEASGYCFQPLNRWLAPLIHKLLAAEK